MKDKMEALMVFAGELFGFEVVTCGRHNTTENQKFFVKLGSSMQGAEGDTFEEALNKAHAAARADVEKRVAALNAALAGKPRPPRPEV
jgi:hypothetical protein